MAGGTKEQRIERKMHYIKIPRIIAIHMLHIFLEVLGFQISAILALRFAFSASCMQACMHLCMCVYIFESLSSRYFMDRLPLITVLLCKLFYPYMQVYRNGMRGMQSLRMRFFMKIS